MIHPKLRTMIVVCGVAAVLLAACAESKACALLDCLFGGRPQAAYMAPCPAPACPPMITPSPCSSCPTPTLVPQTTYRPFFRSAPVVVRPPCTSCRVTTYRPAFFPYATYRAPYATYRAPYATYRIPYATYRAPYATYRIPYATYRIPYATYRTVYTNPCNSCGGGVSYTGTTVGSSCSSCTVGSPVVSYGSPAVSYGGPTAATGSTGAAAPPKTFQETQKPPVKDEVELKPIPNGTDGGAGNGTGPDLGKPISRTTSLPVLRATYYRAAGSQATPATAEPDSLIGVWRASRD